MRHMGIDYGTKRVGIAVSDDAGTMGFPHSIIPNDARLIDTIQDLIEAERIMAIVIGESKDYSGGDNMIAEAARGLGETLAAATGLKVHFEPEMLTTQEAKRDFEGVHVSRSGNVDASAAAIILTSYLSHK